MSLTGTCTVWSRSRRFAGSQQKMNVSKNLYDYPPNGAKQEPEICERCRLRQQNPPAPPDHSAAF
jgi:hypothetical protein